MFNKPGDYFNYKMFKEYINNDLSKQRSLKIVNDMVDERLVEKRINKKKEAAYRIRVELIKYQI